MDWSLDINTLVQLFSLAAIAGMGWMKLQVIERDHLELKSEIRDFRGLRSDIAVIQAQLSNIEKIVKEWREE